MSLFQNLDFSTSGSTALPFWALFGYGEPSELAASLNSAFIAPFVLWLYLVVTIIVFVGLLVDMSPRGIANAIGCSAPCQHGKARWMLRCDVRVHGRSTCLSQK